MTIRKATKIAQKSYGVKVNVRTDERSVFLSGTARDWQSVVAVGKLFADKKSGKHVVNDIICNDVPVEVTLLPKQTDKSLEGTEWDVVVIGGGISGCCVARELARYNLKVLLCEKHSDVAHGASGANDGMVHAGIDLKHKCKKLHYVTIVNAMYDGFCEELGVDFKREGQYVVFGSRLIRLLASGYIGRAKRHGIPGVCFVNKKTICNTEPTVSGYAVSALKIPSTGAVSPYKLTIAVAENAVQNGVKVSLNTAVSGFEMSNGTISAVVTNRGTVKTECVVNCAGVFADVIADMAGDRYFSIHPRKGVDLILDPSAEGLPQNAISLAPTLKMLKANKNTKGGGIIKTVDGNILLGPNAVETPLREDVSTSMSDVNEVFDKQLHCCPSMKKSSIIAYFAGVRACTYEEDFLIERSAKVPNLVHVAGIQSPGLTAAPAFAPDVAKLVVEYLRDIGIEVNKNNNFNPVRNKPVCTKDLDESRLDDLIKNDEDYGKVICRCERVTLGEIKAALNNPLGVATIDGVKRRVRTGMGRCQGGFCMPQIVRIISEQKQIALSDVQKGDEGSYVAAGEIKSE